MTKIDTYDKHNVNQPFTTLTQQSIRSQAAKASVPSYDPELAMDDGSDALYAEALLNSEFAKWLGTVDAADQESLQALDRLRMMVAHITQDKKSYSVSSSSSRYLLSTMENSSSAAASSQSSPSFGISPHPSYSSSVLDAIQDPKGKSKARK